MTYINKSQSKVRNSSNLVFFVSIAFALIPANFITIIIREKEKNTKHLQIVSGISLFAYWLSNVIFELVKYYTTGAICLALMSAYSQSTNEMWVIYFIYGLTMIPFTYLFTFFFFLLVQVINLVLGGKTFTLTGADYVLPALVGTVASGSTTYCYVGISQTGSDQPCKL